MVFAPANTPQPVMDKLNQTLNAVLTASATRERMTKEGFEALPTSAADARSRLQKEMPQWSKLVKDRGITME
jgi:tripartite-type tricarboxylate transporter receptor subunit TctC